VRGQRSGSGTSADPYLITSTSDLDQLAANANSSTYYQGVYFKQTKDIAYSTDGVGDTESNFTSIGHFKGHYDGQGHTISGIRIYKINACRAYFQLSDGNPAHEFVLNFGEETTSLREISNEELIISNYDYYTLDGRKLDEKPTKKGLYIVNGKKIVIK
jgi:hypothetical protein